MLISLRIKFVASMCSTNYFLMSVFLGTGGHHRVVSENSASVSSRNPAPSCANVILFWNSPLPTNYSWIHLRPPNPQSSHPIFLVFPWRTPWATYSLLQWPVPPAHLSRDTLPSNGGGTTWQSKRGDACFQVGHTQRADMTVKSMNRRVVDLQRIKIKKIIEDKESRLRGDY